MFFILLVVATVLLFVIFAKRPVNTAGLHAMPAVRIEPAAPPKAAEPLAQSAPVAPAPAPVVDTMNFNDMFGGKPSTKSDRPNA